MCAIHTLHRHSQLPLVNACALLGVDAEDVKEALLTNVITTTSDTIVRRNAVVQSCDARDAMAKVSSNHASFLLLSDDGTIRDYILAYLAGWPSKPTNCWLHPRNSRYFIRHDERNPL